MIQKATLKDIPLTQETRFAPFVDEYIVFIIDNQYVICDEEIHNNFNINKYREIFNIIETIE